MYPDFSNEAQARRREFLALRLRVLNRGAESLLASISHKLTAISGREPRSGKRCSAPVYQLPQPPPDHHHHFKMAAIPTRITSRQRYSKPRRMKVLPLDRIQMLFIALTVCIVIGFTLQLLSVPSHQRSFPLRRDGLNFSNWTIREQRVSSDVKTCQPKQHIVFLKTHKTAGSTILNILHRYGEQHNLTFALPVNYQFGYPNMFHSRWVKGFRPDRKQEYHIMCHHMRFHLYKVKKIMPEDSFFFSILRNPMTMAESSYAYYKDFSPAFKKASSFEDFINNPFKFYNTTKKGNQFARNLLSFDFGFDNNAQFNTMYASRAVAAVEMAFQLILVAEYFDESMVLLKEALCWELDDVVAFKMNFRSKDSVQALSPQAMEKLKQWNALDWYLYTHFNRTFWQKVEQFGWKRIRKEVLLLQKKQKELMNQCLQGDEPVESKNIKDKSIRPFQYGRTKIYGWLLKPDLDPLAKERCIRMITPELQYKDLLTAKQFPPTKSSMTPVLGKKPPLNELASLSGKAVQRP